MKRNKKAFTLIELLAVIVILAVIALIAVPVVMNIITKARKSAFKDSAYGIIKAAELYYADKLLEPEGIVNDKIFTFPNAIDGLEFDGDVPESGSIMILADGNIGMAITSGKYCIKKDFLTNELTVYDNLDECSPLRVPIFAPNQNIESESDCIRYRETCPNGTLVKVQVNDLKNYDFYVINDTKTELTLIMSENLGGATKWYNAYANSRGPLTALEALQTRTVDWTNIGTYDYTLIVDRVSGASYDSIEVKNARARLLTYTEFNDLKLANGNKTPIYLHTNLDDDDATEMLAGYWLSTSSSIAHAAWDVRYGGSACDSCNHSDISGANSNNGVRPVITISK